MIKRTIDTVEVLVRLLAKPTKKNLEAVLSLAEDLTEKLGQEGVVHLKDELQALASGDRDIWARTLAALIRGGHSNLYGRLKPLSPFADDILVIRRGDQDGHPILQGDVDRLLQAIDRPAAVWRQVCRHCVLIAISPKNDIG